MYDLVVSYTFNFHKKKEENVEDVYLEKWPCFGRDFTALAIAMDEGQQTTRVFYSKVQKLGNLSVAL